MVTMKAIRIHEFGTPAVMRYEDIPRPQPGVGEVLIKVHAIGTNPVDWGVVRGHAAGWLPSDFPIIPGWDVSGVVETVGEGVVNFSTGDEVYGLIRFPQWGRAYAEYVTAPIMDITLKPRSIDHIHAAGVPLAALTAWQAVVDRIKLASGQTILITGGAGGVGHFAVQIAKALGAYITATASTANGDFVRSLGADRFVDYTAGPFEDVVHDQDAVFDTVGADTLDRAYKTLKPGGVIALISGAPNAALAKQYQIRAERFLVAPDAVQLAEIARLIDAGQIKPFVDTVFPLSEAAKAHLQGETHRTRGKLVLAV